MFSAPGYVAFVWCINRSAKFPPCAYTDVSLGVGSLVGWDTSQSLGLVLVLRRMGLLHGGNSKGTTCVVDRDVTAYLVVDRVLRFPTEQYGYRYGRYPEFNDLKVIFRHILLFYFQNLFLAYFSFLRKA